MKNLCKQSLAWLLLVSLFLESCHNLYNEEITPPTPYNNITFVEEADSSPEPSFQLPTVQEEPLQVTHNSLVLGEPTDALTSEQEAPGTEIGKASSQQAGHGPLIAKGGHQVWFKELAAGKLEATVEECLPVGITRRLVLPVYLAPGMSLSDLEKYKRHITWQKNHIQVELGKQKGHVLVGNMGLPGGMTKDPEEDKGSSAAQGAFSNFEKIGEGSFGVVYKGLWKRNPAESISVAIKTLKELDKVEELSKEKSIMENVIHKNIVRYFGIHDVKIGKALTKTIVTELMSEGSVEEFLGKTSKQAIKPLDIVSFAIDAATGMRYLHENDIIHRDLAARNLLLTKEQGRLLAKVSDFGLSRKIPSEQEAGRDYYKVTSEKNPIRWCAPEYFIKKEVSVRSDLWSFGVLLYELFTFCKTLPYEDLSNVAVIKQIKQGKKMYKHLEMSDCPEGIQDLLNQCMNYDSKTRPDFDKIIPRLKEIQGLVKNNNTWQIADDNNTIITDLGSGTYDGSSSASKEEETEESKLSQEATLKKEQEEKTKQLTEVVYKKLKEEKELAAKEAAYSKLLEEKEKQLAEVTYKKIKEEELAKKAVVYKKLQEEKQFQKTGLKKTQEKKLTLQEIIERTHNKIKKADSVKLNEAIKQMIQKLAGSPAQLDEAIRAVAPHGEAMVKILGNNSTEFRCMGDPFLHETFIPIDMAVLVNHARFKELTKIDLHDQQLNDTSLQMLASHLPNTQIHTLDLSENYISASGVQWLAQALSKSQIHTLNLESNPMGASGAQSLAVELSKTQIHTLDLSKNKIGDSGAEALAKELSKTQIHTLDLSKNKIGDSGAQSLAAALSKTQIHTLNLSRNQIGDSGAQSLAAELSKTQIHTLNLGWNQIGDSTKKLLREQYPNIDWGF